MHELWDAMKKRYQSAAQDLAYAAKRSRDLSQHSTASQREKFSDWLDMVTENHRRCCEQLGIDTNRVPPRNFPLTEQEVHHILLTDPYAYAIATLLDHVDRESYTPDNGYRAALIINALYETGCMKQTPFARNEAVRQAMFNTYKITIPHDTV